MFRATRINNRPQQLLMSVYLPSLRPLVLSWQPCRSVLSPQLSHSPCQEF